MIIRQTLTDEQSFLMRKLYPHLEFKLVNHVQLDIVFSIK